MSDKISLLHGFSFSCFPGYSCMFVFPNDTTCLAPPRKTYRYFYKDCIKLTHEFSESSYPRIGCVFPCLSICSSILLSFPKVLKFPQNKVCTFLVKFISRYLVFFFVPIVHWVFSTYITSFFICVDIKTVSVY